MKKSIGAAGAVFSALALAVGMATPAAADSPSNGRWNNMRALHTGMCAAVGNNSTKVGAGLIQYRCDYKSNKEFYAQGAGTNAYFLRIRSTNMCVTPQTGADHALLVQSPCANVDSQVWVAEYAGNDSWKMRNRATGFCMGVAWGTTNSGQPLDQSSCGAFDGQTWRFTAV
ncbi:RICIN domain-containing protein [Streptomyces sp. C11-1]|uniref:RICIN domain-containing protein n=1 Tax=Streptomyces durocortorensis TaxID=2811104 RepID=A0ABY9W5S9_9ACTN|nr:RICIN domain-containing protein [Streptomyces durocortorensis]WNF30205.1 RICIN domain-containing protein [Streptomyces durocortorensis]